MNTLSPPASTGVLTTGLDVVAKTLSFNEQLKGAAPAAGEPSIPYSRPWRLGAPRAPACRSLNCPAGSLGHRAWRGERTGQGARSPFRLLMPNDPGGTAIRRGTGSR